MSTGEGAVAVAVEGEGVGENTGEGKDDGHCHYLVFQQGAPTTLTKKIRGYFSCPCEQRWQLIKRLFQRPRCWR